jgi:hypothetical protein
VHCTFLCAISLLPGIIEQRTSEILQAYAAAQSGQPNGESHSFQLPSPNILSAFGGGDNIGTNTNASTMSRLTVQPPSYEEMSSGGENSEGEEDERPLTRLELEKITLKDFMRKKQ